MVLSSWLRAIARVHPVHFMNADWAPGGRQLSDQANRLGLWVRRKLAAIICIHCRRLLLLLIPFYIPTEGGRLSRSRHYRNMQQPVPKTAYHNGCRDKRTDGGKVRSGDLTHRSQATCECSRLLLMFCSNNKSSSKSFGKSTSLPPRRWMHSPTACARCSLYNV